MQIKNVVYEDFVNYKKPSMFIVFPFCTFKCEKDSGIHCCQNSDLAHSPIHNVAPDELINRYLTNPITSAVVCGGLEPFDSWKELYEFIILFRKRIDDDFVIYTGYYPHEIKDKIEKLKQFKNIIIKFGRFIPDKTSCYNDVLGVNLASDNQFAKRIN